MKLTKFVHACILVEDEEHTALFDPGQFSWESGLFNVDALDRLDRVIISHEHFDHFHLPFVKEIFSRFPDVTFVSTEQVVAQLHEQGITNASSTSDDLADVAPLEHASMAPLAPLPMSQNIRVHYKNKVTHPGDSLELTETKDVLFLPLAGPWEAAINAVRLAVSLKPKVVVPIHDWMWSEQWRNVMHDRMEAFFGEQGIRFIKAIDGEPVEIE